MERSVGRHDDSLFAVLFWAIFFVRMNVEQGFLLEFYALMLFECAIPNATMTALDSLNDY